MNTIKYLMLILVVLAASAITGCATNPVTGKKQIMFGEIGSDVKVGKEYAPKIEEQLGGKIENAALQAYIDSVGQKVARISHYPDLKFSFVALNDESMNAFALPGGYIFITRGMLEKLETEAQLASILAHEAVHVTARHSAAAMNQQIGMGLLLMAASKASSSQGVATAARLTSQLVSMKYSRDDEKEADAYGMDYMVKAGYSPKGMVETMEILNEENSARSIEFFSTHPNPENRIGLLNRHIGRKGYDYNYQGLRVSPTEYKANVLDILETIPKKPKRTTDPK